MKPPSSIRFIGLSLILGLMFGACGKLDPNTSSTLERERIEREERERDNAVVVSTLSWNQTGNVDDLQYKMTFESGPNLFKFDVTRANREARQKTIRLSATDHPAIHAALTKLFMGKYKITALNTCPACDYNANASVARKDQTVLEYRFPELLVPAAGGTPFNLFDNLSQFILDRQ